MANFKANRTAEDIHFQLTDIFRELKDPRIDPMLTIIKVDLSNDMSHCKVYVSSFEGIERAKKSVQGLESAMGFIRRELFSRLAVKKCPELKFIPDDSTEKSRELIEKLRGMDLGQ
jgi:ribosome-binding factor A